MEGADDARLREQALGCLSSRGQAMVEPVGAALVEAAGPLGPKANGFTFLELRRADLQVHYSAT